MKYIKSNIGFIISMLVLLAFMLNPQLKSFVLRGLMKTGVFNPSVDPSVVSGAGRKLLQAPDFAFKDLSGKVINLSDLKGKVVFLNFWATWCPPCIAEMPAIQALKNGSNSKDVIFVMVDVDGTLKASEAFMRKNSYDLPVFAATGPIATALFQGSMPTTVIINKKGEMVFRHEGIADYNSAEMKELVKYLSL